MKKLLAVLLLALSCTSCSGFEAWVHDHYAEKFANEAPSDNSPFATYKIRNRAATLGRQLRTQLRPARPILR